jgi:hypothetical protein
MDSSARYREVKSLSSVLSAAADARRRAEIIRAEAQATVETANETRTRLFVRRLSPDAATEFELTCRGCGPVAPPESAPAARARDLRCPQCGGLVDRAR